MFHFYLLHLPLSHDVDGDGDLGSCVLMQLQLRLSAICCPDVEVKKRWETTARRSLLSAVHVVGRAVYKMNTGGI